MRKDIMDFPATNQFFISIYLNLLQTNQDIHYM